MNMIDSKLLDSSVWLEFVINDSNKEIMESDVTLFISTLSIFEIKEKLIKKLYEESDIIKILDFIKKRSIVVNVDKEIVEKAVELAIKYDLATIDSIIYASVIMNSSEFIILDNDFRNLPNVSLI